MADYGSAVPEAGEYALSQLVCSDALMNGMPYSSSTSDSLLVLRENNKLDTKMRQKSRSVGTGEDSKQRLLTSSDSDLRLALSTTSDAVDHSGGSLITGPATAREPGYERYERKRRAMARHDAIENGSASPSGTGHSHASPAPSQHQRSPMHAESTNTSSSPLAEHSETNSAREAAEAEAEVDGMAWSLSGELTASTDELEGDESASKEKESPGRRKVGLQANLRRLSVRLNVPNIFRFIPLSPPR
jgi:hypothetical protein